MGRPELLMSRWLKRVPVAAVQIQELPQVPASPTARACSRGRADLWPLLCSSGVAQGLRSIQGPWKRVHSKSEGTEGYSPLHPVT
jgi:hypothetical protein